MSVNPEHDGAIVEPDPGYVGGSEKQPDAVHSEGETHAEGIVTPDPDWSGGAAKQPGEAHAEGVIAPDPGAVTGGGIKQSDPEVTGG